MQSLNIMIVDKGKYINQLRQSKYLNKLYIASNNNIEGAIPVKFNTFRELAKKSRALHIDIVLVDEEKWILEGIADVMKSQYINCLAATSKWTNLKLSHAYAQTMLSKYKINIPPKINLPVEFPVLVKGDGISKKANSMQEIIDIKEKIYNNTSSELAKKIYLEKYLKGEKQKVISIFDGKHLLTFPHNKISPDLLNEYSKKLERMLIQENANFIGFINSELIIEDNLLYNTGFSFEFTIPYLSENIANKYDILFICLSAIYQKLDELEF